MLKRGKEGRVLCRCGRACWSTSCAGLPSHINTTFFFFFFFFWQYHSIDEGTRVPLIRYNYATEEVIPLKQCRLFFFFLFFSFNSRFFFESKRRDVRYMSRWSALICTHNIWNGTEVNWIHCASHARMMQGPKTMHAVSIRCWLITAQRHLFANPPPPPAYIQTSLLLFCTLFCPLSVSFCCERNCFVLLFHWKSKNGTRLSVCVWRGLSEIVSLVHRGMSRVVVESAAFIIYRVVSFDVLWASKQAACLYSLVEDDDIALLGPGPVRLLYLSFFSSIE